MKIELKPPVSSKSIKDLEFGTVFEWNNNVWLRINSGAVCLGSELWQYYSALGSPFFNCAPIAILGTLSVSK